MKKIFLFFLFNTLVIYSQNQVGFNAGLGATTAGAGFNAAYSPDVDENARAFYFLGLGVGEDASDVQFSLGINYFLKKYDNSVYFGLHVTRYANTKTIEGGTQTENKNFYGPGAIVGYRFFLDSNKKFDIKLGAGVGYAIGAKEYWDKEVDDAEWFYANNLSEKRLSSNWAFSFEATIGLSFDVK